VIYGNICKTLLGYSCQKMKERFMRLNKYLSDAGVCSRREADRLIEEGRVLVDGKPAIQGMQVEDTQEIKVDGKVIKPEEKKVVLVFHKPKGIECTANINVKKNVISYINYPIRVYYAGRLDKDSEGLLLLTNQGELVNQIMKAGSYHEKEYRVTVDKMITEKFLQKMRDGVPILGTVTRKCKVERESEKTFRITLTQGLNRQIRRMCNYLGYEVIKLKRIRIMNIELGDLPVGSYREATKEELDELKRQIDENTDKSKSLGVVFERGKKPIKNAGKYRNPSKVKNRKAW
jgi:23S rRNA pseudouridine2604 synthase